MTMTGPIGRNSHSGARNLAEKGELRSLKTIRREREIVRRLNVTMVLTINYLKADQVLNEIIFFR